MLARGRSMRVFALATTASLALVACGEGSGGSGGEGDGSTVTLTIQWWGNDDRASRYEAAIDAFHIANPGIKVNTGFAAWPDYWTARNTEAAGGALPDVLQMDTSYLRQYAGTGRLLDLTPYAGEELDLSGFDETLVEAGKVDGRLYAVATGTNTLALFYNPALLAELGIEMPEDFASWEAYAELIAAVSEAGAGRDPAVYGGADPTGTFWLFLQWLIQRGTEPFTEDGGLNFTREQMAEWLELTADAREAGAVFPAERLVQLEPVSPFSAVESGTEFHWDNFLASYVGESGVKDLELMPVPSGPDGAKHQFFKPTMQLAAGAGTEHPEEAARLIDFLVNSPQLAEVFGANLGVPASRPRREAMSLLDGSMDARIMDYETSLTAAGHVSAVAPLPVEGFGAIEEEYRTLHQEFSYGGMSTEEFTDRWFTEAENHLGG
ncbi:ABC transporter substrate-binding protein [Streptomyces aidingensis]|uniref:Multiple sugar transport system substrate-binding protein n=1 Tax=Streptomyces aidingensis TaxID=910347 RepID=A0A1I1V1B9_9ACTN|nr:ABC transporter substrate-binding protein [Streptomyces aidingensis]SFD76679.1 multiple sugar transport system substrate-binding protein [Streptomyces aidingensis]